MKRFITAVIVYTVFLSLEGSALPPRGIITHYSTEQGLANNAVVSIHQDNKGFLWFGTWDGLSRFDGYKFVNYNTSNQPALSHNRISALYEDPFHNLWILTYDQKLFRLNRKTDRIEPLTDLLPEVKDSRIRLVQQVSNGEIWAVANGVGVIRIFSIPESNRVEVDAYPFPDSDNISLMLIDSEEQVWIALGEELIALFPRNGNYEMVPEHSVERARVVTAIESQGVVYFATADQNLICYPQGGSGFRIIHIPYSYNIISMGKSRDGSAVYLGTRNGGLITFQADTENFTRMAHEAQILGIHTDSHNLVWLRTDQRGILKYDPVKKQYKQFTQAVNSPESFLNKNYGRIREMDDRLWLSMNGGGFGYYNREEDCVEYFYNNPETMQHPPLSNVVSLFRLYSDHQIWMTTNRRGVERVFLIDPKVRHMVPEPDRIRRMENQVGGVFCDSKGKFWVGTRVGKLIRYNRDMEKELVLDADDQGHPFGFIYTIAEDTEGRIWIGTRENGLFSLTPRSNDKYTVRHYAFNPDDSFSLSQNKIHSICVDRERRIWIATFGGGVNLLEETAEGEARFLSYRNTFKSYPPIKGKKVRSIREDAQGNIWAGTSEGMLLLTYHPETRDISIVLHERETGREEGLSSNDIVYVYRDRDNRMWLATYGGGINRFEGYAKDGKPLYKQYHVIGEGNSNEIKSICEDHVGRLWFATENNICSVEKESGLLTIFSQYEGIDPEAFFSEGAVTKDEDGNIYFGNVHGIYIVSPEELGKEEISFRLQFTDFLLNGLSVTPSDSTVLQQTITETERIELQKSHSVFDLEFVSLNFGVQHRVHYHYILEGYDRDWIIEDHDRHATYKNVPAGNYRFKVKAFLPENPNHYEMRELAISILTPFWASGMAIMLYVFIILLLASLSLFFTRRKRIYARILRERRAISISPTQIAISHAEDEVLMQAILGYLEKNYGNPEIKIEDIVQQTQLSRTSFYNRLKELTDMSPHEFLKDFRFKKSEMYLRQSTLTIAEITYKIGFTDPGYFAQAFRKRYNQTPTAFRKSHQEKMEADESAGHAAEE